MNDWIYHCKILGVSPEASAAEIKKSYMDQAKLFHPDMHQDSDVAKAKFQQLQESYDYLLKNQRSRPNQRIKVEVFNDEDESLRSKFKILAICVSISCVIVVTALVIQWPKRKTVITQSAVTEQDIADTLNKYRLYIYEMNSNKDDCYLLNRENRNYHSLVATSEKFANNNCGDVRANFDPTDKQAAITVVSPTLESCRCQVAFLKKKNKKVDKKSSFSDADLQ